MAGSFCVISGMLPHCSVGHRVYEALGCGKVMLNFLMDILKKKKLVKTFKNVTLLCEGKDTLRDDRQPLKLETAKILK